VTLSTDTLSETVTRTSLTAYVLADCLRTYAYTSGPTWKRLIDCYRSPGVHAMIACIALGTGCGRNRSGCVCCWSRSISSGSTISARPGASRLDARRKLAPAATSAISAASLFQAGRGSARIATCHKVSRLACPAKGRRQGSRLLANVYIAPGAKLFGKIRIGHNVKIGANAVVHKDVPDQHVVAAPAFVILSETRGNRR
jgi:serine O-acetyltransferase